GFTAGLSVLTCLLFGLVPALSATRRASGIAMHVATRGSTSSRESAALRRGLVIAPVPPSVVLLFRSLLLLRRLRDVLAIDPGFHASGVVSAEIGFTRLQLPPANNAAYRKLLLERVSAVPGVERAGLVNVVPMSGLSTSNTVWAETDSSRRFSSRLN